MRCFGVHGGVGGIIFPIYINLCTTFYNSGWLLLQFAVEVDLLVEGVERNDMQGSERIDRLKDKN